MHDNRPVRIFHIVDRSTWESAGDEYVPASFEDDGFVHFSFADQVARVANSLYRDEPELIVVEIDPDAVPARLVVEDCYEAGEQFPHIYGPIPRTAEVARHELTRTSDGDWAFSVAG